MTFDLSGHGLTLGGVLDFPSVSAVRYVTVKNGTVDFGGCELMDSGTWGMGSNFDITFDGCVVTNVEKLILGQGSNGSFLHITNSTVVCSGNLAPSSYGNGNDRIEITGGSKVAVAGFTCSTSSGGSAPTPTLVHPQVKVAGTGTALTVSGSGARQLVGYCGGSLKVCDGAQMTVADSSDLTCIGVGGTCDGRVIAEGPGSVLAINTGIRFNQGEGGGTNNFLCARDGAAITIAGAISGYWQSGSHNGLLCSNGVITCSHIDGQGTHEDFIFRLQGSNPSIAFTHTGDSNYWMGGRHFIFDLPPSGYAEGCLPISFAGQNFLLENEPSANITLKLNGLGEYCRGLAARGVRRSRVTLIGGPGYFAGGWGGLSRQPFDDAVARWNEELQANPDLPGYAHASISNDGIVVTLDVKLSFGMSVLVR